MVKFLKKMIFDINIPKMLANSIIHPSQNYIQKDYQEKFTKMPN